MGQGVLVSRQMVLVPRDQHVKMMNLRSYAVFPSCSSPLLLPTCFTSSVVLNAFVLAFSAIRGFRTASFSSAAVRAWADILQIGQRARHGGIFSGIVSRF